MLNHDVIFLQVKSEFHSVQEIQRREEGGERDKTLKHDHIGYIYIDNDGCVDVLLMVMSQRSVGLWEL